MVAGNRGLKRILFVINDYIVWWVGVERWKLYIINMCQPRSINVIFFLNNITNIKTKSLLNINLKIILSLFLIILKPHIIVRISNINSSCIERTSIKNKPETFRNRKYGIPMARVFHFNIYLAQRHIPRSSFQHNSTALHTSHPQPFFRLVCGGSHNCPPTTFSKRVYTHFANKYLITLRGNRTLERHHHRPHTRWNVLPSLWMRTSEGSHALGSVCVQRLGKGLGRRSFGKLALHAKPRISGCWKVSFFPLQ